MNIAIIFLLIWWIPIYIYLIIWSIRIRFYVKKNKISSLDGLFPPTYKIGKLTDFQKLGESITYATAIFCGPILFFILPRKLISKPILPDA